MGRCICYNCQRPYYSGLWREKPFPYDRAKFCCYKCAKEGEWKTAHEITLPLDVPRTERPQNYEITSQWLLDEAKKPGGATCPCCRRHVQVYQYTISQSMAQTLLILFRHFNKYPDSKPVHLDSYISIFGKKRPKGNNHGLLVCWGLLEKCPGKVKRGAKVSGYYKITHSGIDFVLGKLLVPSYAVIYNNRLWELRGPKIGIGDALKEPFNFETFMNQEI